MDVIIKTKKCNGNHTSFVNSPYPKDSVPISEFMKNGKELKTCSRCREQNNVYTTKSRNKRVELAKTLKDDEYCYCGGKAHDKANSLKSEHEEKYPRDRVPKQLFIIRQTGNNIEYSLSCIDCRNYDNSEKRKFLFNKKIVAIEQGLLPCNTCSNGISINEVVLNADGSRSGQCQRCKNNSIEYKKKIVNVKRQVKLEFMIKQQCSCYKCKCLYFKPEDGSIIVQRFETFLKIDGNRYWILNGVEYPVHLTLSMSENLLEYIVLDWDHLPEKEQRERGLLKDTDVYIPKKTEVATLLREVDIRLETQKCQLVCVRCHVEETRDRISTIDTKEHKSSLGVKKRQYYKELKMAGCNICKYTNPNLLPFFDLDHIDPSLKSKCVSSLIPDPNCDFETFVEECNKCRVLCRHCHRIHTRNQIANGILHGKKSFETGKDNTYLCDTDQIDKTLKYQ